MSRTERAVIVWKPQPRQLEFMRRPEPEALYGGAAGGGKSDALLIEALRQVHIPHYRALILRKTYPQLSDLVDKSQMYYRRAFPEAQYNATSHVWVFPSGAKIWFGSMQYTKDRTNYQGKAYDFIGFDELTHFEWDEYSYMMSRNRPTGPGTRVYMRATTNPGGIGHGWVKARFITPAPPGTRMVQLVGDDRTSSALFGMMLCITQVLVAPVAFIAGGFIAPLDNRAQLRPLVYIASIAVVCLAEHLVLWLLRSLPRRAQLLRIVPLAALNSGVLGTVLVERTQSFTLGQSWGFGFGSGLGYVLAVLLVTEARHRLRSKAIPEAFRGLPITLVYIGVLALAIYGFTGHSVIL